MSTRQQPIYEVKVAHLLEAFPGEPPKTEISFFTNLKKTVDTIGIVLEANGWPVIVNYSAVYRQLKSRGFYTRIFSIEQVRYFRLTITPRVINPHLTSLGIEEMPRPGRTRLKRDTSNGNIS